jgi:hypothetical protein
VTQFLPSSRLLSSADLFRFVSFRSRFHLAGINPTIGSYNASVVKIYTAVAYYNDIVVVVNLDVGGLASGLNFIHYVIYVHIYVRCGKETCLATPIDKK